MLYSDERPLAIHKGKNWAEFIKRKLGGPRIVQDVVVKRKIPIRMGIERRRPYL
jgi:hypothetical protein